MAAELDHDRLKDLYRLMAITRRVDQEAVALMQGRLHGTTMHEGDPELAQRYSVSSRSGSIG
jgi:TPP-dependent pyruvate/acetoin dehydrogenase alpha subunit